MLKILARLLALGLVFAAIGPTKAAYDVLPLVNTTGTQTITTTQWMRGDTILITTASQTITLPVATTLGVNGGVYIVTVGQPVTLAPNPNDGINGGTINTSVTIPGNYVAWLTTSGASGTGAFNVPLGLVAGSFNQVTANSNGTTTIGSAPSVRFTVATHIKAYNGGL